MSTVRSIILLFSALLLASCTIQLAPDYDAALVEGLDDANTEALTLFAAVEPGSPTSEFPEHEGHYSKLIGRFDALRQRAATRQVPPLAKRLSKIPIVSNLCNSQSDPAACVNSSPASLSEVLKIFRRMRDAHRTQGLTPDTVGLFRDGYYIAVDQALTVENALER
jgi:hypothetical protein